MSGLVLALLMSTPSAFGQEVILRNDVTPQGGTYGPGNAQVLWAESPECVVSVLTPEASDLPLEIHTIRVLFGTSGFDDSSSLSGRDAVVELGIQQLNTTQQAPTGRGDWIWGEEAFTVTITSEYLNDLVLDDFDNGFFPIELREGKLAVWICAPDRDGGGPWPTEGRETSGILISTTSPDAGNYIYSPDIGGVQPLSLISDGSFVIRAVAGEGNGNPGEDDTGNPSGGDDTGNPHVDGDFYIQSITPSSAPQGESVDIVILGDGFVAGTEARIGGISLTGTDVASPETIIGRTPTSLPAGLHDVEVILPDGESDYLAQAFEVTGGCGCSAHDGYRGRSLPLVAFAMLGLVALRRRD